jgi:hypothetical protein
MSMQIDKYVERCLDADDLIVGREAEITLSMAQACRVVGINEITLGSAAEFYGRAGLVSMLVPVSEGFESPLVPQDVMRRLGMAVPGPCLSRSEFFHQVMSPEIDRGVRNFLRAVEVNLWTT